MKIGIIGTRGIPNQYGGFEQFAEFVAPALVEKGHEVFVYNSSLHPYQGTTWRGVQLLKKKDPENKIGTAGQFLYDLSCIWDARGRNYDVILQLGYTSSSIWSFLFPKRTVIVTNMDGLEWKRSKYARPVQQFLKKAEKWAVLHSHTLIADSKGIQAYLKDKYGKDSEFIAYGASLFEDPDEKALHPYDLTPWSYDLLIARMEPENNVETILQGRRQSDTKRKLILIGNYKNAFGTYLKEKYSGPGILFFGPIYDLPLLNNLRYYSNLYFHGHSVGGTNPSLLEAMASRSLVIAHDNIFNRTVLEEDAFYFSGSPDVTSLLDRDIRKSDFQSFLDHNSDKIQKQYSWEHITGQLEKCLAGALGKSAAAI